MGTRLSPLSRTPDRVAVVGRCVAMCDRAVAALEASAADDVAILRAHVGVLREWHLNHVTDAVLRDGVREMARTRDTMKRAVEVHEAGLGRIDASVRTAVAFMCWRTGAYAMGTQDETVEVWCRMGLGETLARYADSASDADAASSGMDESAVSVYPVPLTAPVVHALYARDPERSLRRLLAHLRAEWTPDQGARGAEIIALHWPRSAEPLAEFIAGHADTHDEAVLLMLRSVALCCETFGAPADGDALATLQASVASAYASPDEWISGAAAATRDAITSAVERANPTPEEAE